MYDVFKGWSLCGMFGVVLSVSRWKCECLQGWQHNGPSDAEPAARLLHEEAQAAWLLSRHITPTHTHKTHTRQPPTTRSTTLPPHLDVPKDLAGCQ